MPGKGVVLGVCPASRGQRGDEDGLQRDEDLAEAGLLHQTLELLEVDADAEGGAVAVNLNASMPRSHHNMNPPLIMGFFWGLCFYTGLLQSSSSLSVSLLVSLMNFSSEPLRLMAFFRI